jgi:hypothetical protein
VSGLRRDVSVTWRLQVPTREARTGAPTPENQSTLTPRRASAVYRSVRPPRKMSGRARLVFSRGYLVRKARHAARTYS